MARASRPFGLLVNLAADRNFFYSAYSIAIVKWGFVPYAHQANTEACTFAAL